MSKLRHGPFWWTATKLTSIAVNTSVLSSANPIPSTFAFGPFKTMEEASANALAFFAKNNYKTDQYSFVIAEAVSVARPIPPPPLQFVPLDTPTDEEE